MKNSYYCGYDDGFKDGSEHGKKVIIAIMAKMYLTNEYPEDLQMELRDFLLEKEAIEVTPRKG